MSCQSARLAAALSLLSTAAIAHAQTRVVYVDQAASEGGDGTSWPLAFNTLQAALAEVGSQYTSTDLEVRVAGGIYRATQWSGFYFSPQPTNSSIVISIKGSYLGLESPTPDVRDFVSARTTLSGDELGDDTSDPSTWSDNAGDVFSGGLASLGTLVIDGLEIVACHGDSGLRVWTTNGAGRVSVRNCDIHENHGASGAGVQIYQQYAGQANAATIEFFDCRIHDNVAIGFGGAIKNGSNRVPLRLERCVIEGNSARDAGGIYTNQCSIKLINCVVRGNVTTSSLGGGIYAGSSEVIAEGCLFANNSAASTNGGGINAQSVTLSNCTVVGNQARIGAGVVAARATLTNCIFSGNTGSQLGNDLYISGSLAASHTIVDLQLVNGQLPGGGYPSGDTSTVSTLDPLFQSRAGADNNPLTWQDNDFRLLPASPAIDAGEMRAGLYLLDIAGTSRLTAGSPGHPPALDLGCYEFPGIPRCPADVDNGQAGGDPDGAVTVDDLLYFLEHFEEGC